MDQGVILEQHDTVMLESPREPCVGQHGLKHILLRIANLAGAAGAAFEAVGTDNLKADGMGDCFNGIIADHEDNFIMWNRTAYKV